MEKSLLNGAITFDVNGEVHKIEVKSASESEVTLTISSEPMEVTIAAGESELVDLNGDGEADMELTYHKLFAGGYADLTFTLVSEPIEMPEEEEKEEEVLEEVEVPEKVAEPVGGLTVTLAVIVIILIIGYALIKGKKK